MFADDDSTRIGLTELLANAGFTVDVARDGAEAVDKMARHDFSVILLDVHLRGLGAWMSWPETGIFKQEKSSGCKMGVLFRHKIGNVGYDDFTRMGRPHPATRYRTCDMVSYKSDHSTTK